MGVTETFRLAILRYRAAGGHQYRLAIDHGMSPSVLSATLSGARPVAYDERIVAIGAVLGLTADQVFEPDPPAVAS